MEGHFVMSNQEANRLQIMEKLKRKELTQKETAALLSVTGRQVRRILRRYLKEGAVGLTHKGRGKPSNRRVSPEEVAAAIERLKTPLYAGFAPTFAHEQLVKNHLITFGVDTLRHLMTENNVWMPKKVRPVIVHQLRERMPHYGDMVQLDGSPHDWFEGRIDPETGVAVGECSLHLMIDDATNNLKLRLAKEENTLDYFRLMYRYLTEEGKPLRTYSDKHSIFTVNWHEHELATHRTPSRQGDGEEAKTQFERAMEILCIQMILANSPQAKGRAENANGTLQDRLVKEMRLRNICSLKAANDYLPTFEKDFNQKFGVSPKNSINTHRPLTTFEREHLMEILSLKTTRVLSKNLTCQLNNVIYQIEAKRSGYTLRHAQVNICQTMTGKTIITHQNQRLSYQTITLRPKQHTLTTKQLSTMARQEETAKPHSFWESWAENSWNTYDPAYQTV